MKLRPSAPPSVQLLRLDLTEGGDGAARLPIEIELRRSRRARRTHLRVRPGKLPEVVLPAAAPLSDAQRMLERHRDWLRQKLKWARDIEAEAGRLGLLSPGLVWLETYPLPLATLPSPAETWYRDQARAKLVASTAALADDLARSGVISRRPGRITIRDPRSRWGSCSARGDLSYSWRLVMMPCPVLEYVVCHELCHLEVHNHSPSFWRLLDRARPGWRKEAAWLRRYGPLISLHRAAAGPVTACFGKLPGVDGSRPATPAASSDT